MARHLEVTDSDIIKTIAYDYKLAQMEIVFKTSPDVVYTYFGVMADQFCALINAPSIGQEFHKSFKKWKQFTKGEFKPTLKK